VLDKGQVAIVAGFQGVSTKGEITTLGRGGSDTTAVALAIALKAPLVEFYKDVAGIYDEDPKLNSNAKHLPELSYAAAIALAQKNGVALSVLSFNRPKEGGTQIGFGSKRPEAMFYEVVE